MANGFMQRFKGRIVAAQLWLQQGGLFYESYTDSITAATTQTQAAATLLTSEVNRIATSATSGNGVKLPPSVAGLSIMVINHAANPVQVYGSGSDTIDDQTATVGVSQMPGSVAFYICATAGAWYSEGIGTGYAGSLQTVSFADALSANSGGVQAAATPITTSIARFTTVGGAGYSAVLPAAAAGLNITVINAAAANVMNVFPAGSDQINGSTNAYPVPPGGVVEFFTTATGVWHTLAVPTPAAVTYSAAVNTTGFTATGAQVAGGNNKVILNLTGTLGAGAALTLPTVANLVAALQAAGINPVPGLSYELEVQNNSGANFAWTLTTNTGWTLTGTAQTIAQTTKRNFLIKLTSLTAATSQSLGQFAIGAAP